MSSRVETANLIYFVFFRERGGWKGLEAKGFIGLLRTSYRLPPFG